MSGSQGSLTAVELRRHEHGRATDGTQTAVAKHDEVITDYTHGCVSPAVTLDGPAPVLTPPQRESAQADLPRLVPSRRRVRSARHRADSPTDEQSELEVLRGTVEVLQTRIDVLEAGLARLLRSHYPHGIPIESRTT
jgi:hypothetical protein